MLRPLHVFMWILGAGSLLLIVGLGWQIQAHAQEGSSPTPDPSLIFYPTVESTGLPPIQTRTPTSTPTATASLTTQPPASATATQVIVPTNTATVLPSATQTPSSTPTVRLTDTLASTATASVPETEVATDTPAPSITLSATNTLTETATATATETETETATMTATDTATASFTSTETPTPTVTDTPTASFTPSDTPTHTITPSPTSTTTRVPPVIETSRPESSTGGSDGGGMPIWILGIGLVLTLLVGGYILTYSLNSAGVDRYADGFILADCPICQDGRLDLEERHYHVAGIPRVRRTVRCDNCRSVLREVSKRQWRYAIDPSANVALYSEFNNQTIDEHELIELAEVVFKMPDYVDEEEE